MKTNISAVIFEPSKLPEVRDIPEQSIQEMIEAGYIEKRLYGKHIGHYSCFYDENGMDKGFRPHSFYPIGSIWSTIHGTFLLVKTNSEYQPVVLEPTDIPQLLFDAEKPLNYIDERRPSHESIQTVYSHLQVETEPTDSIKALEQTFTFYNPDNMVIGQANVVIIDPKWSKLTHFETADLISDNASTAISSCAPFETKTEYYTQGLKGERVPIHSRVALIEHFSIAKAYDNPEELAIEAMDDLLEHLTTYHDVEFMILDTENVMILEDAEEDRIMELSGRIAFLNQNFLFKTTDETLPYLVYDVAENLLQNDLSSLDLNLNEPTFEDIDLSGLNLDEDERVLDESFNELVQQETITTIMEKVMKDEQLSWSAKSIFSYMLMNRFNVTISDLLSVSCDNEETVEASIEELTQHGYIFYMDETDRYFFDLALFDEVSKMVKERFERDGQETALDFMLDEPNEQEVSPSHIYGTEEWYIHKFRPDFTKLALMKRDVDINEKLKFNNVGLIIAAYHGDLEMVKTIVNLGGDFSAFNDAGADAIIAAIINDQEHVVEYFIEIAGISPDGTDLEGVSYGNIAIYYNSLRTLKKIIELGATLDGTPNNLPFIVNAVEMERVEATKTLISAGAKLNIANKDGLTLVEIAKTKSKELGELITLASSEASTLI
ncbi:ankyrin repeat domain-containing protein [Niallia taxi]|uniref:ankyrin repeat domain-containing protein n=1 Tax=Niallia taxi TaxID=2499688 RepID=UPI0015F62189|nr:ankyrin repeat domain-containing protein [Niallia taxi]